MDALAAIVALLKPQAVLSKTVHGRGRWGVRYPSFGQPSFAIVLKGPCWLAADGVPATTLDTGDFLLFPSTPGFTLASDLDVTPQPMHIVPPDRHIDEVVHGDANAEPSASLLGGYFTVDPIESSLVASLLPGMLLIRATDPAIDSVAPIVSLIAREAHEVRPGQSFVLARLAEILLVEALRSAPPDLQEPGLLAGLRDPQLAGVLHGIHTHPGHPWSLVALACEAGLSRSSFAERFARVIGVPPLTYVLHWRIAVARDLLARGETTVAEAAHAVGYESASGFSTAFSRETGQSPKAFMEERRRASQSA